MSGVGLYVRVDEEIAQKLRELVKGRHGLLSYHVNEALKKYLEKLEQENKQTTKKEARTVTKYTNLKPKPKVKQKPEQIVFEQVKAYLTTQYGLDFIQPEPVTIPTDLLEEAIMNVRGSDKRTVEKWIESFYKAGLIKPTTKQAKAWYILEGEEGGVEEDKEEEDEEEGEEDEEVEEEMKDEKDRLLSLNEARSYLNMLYKAEPKKEEKERKVI